MSAGLAVLRMVLTPPSLPWKLCPLPPANSHIHISTGQWSFKGQPGMIPIEGTPGLLEGNLFDPEASQQSGCSRPYGA